MNNYVDEDIPVHMVPDWYKQALYQDTPKGPHASACTEKMAVFIHG